MSTPQSRTKRKRPVAQSATRRPSAQSKKTSADVPLLSPGHVSGFIVGLVTGAIASLGIVAGINPSALPQSVTPSISSVTPSQQQTQEEARQPSFTFFTTLADESFPISASSSAGDSISEYTQYVLQAGSFRALDDADRRRGELAFLGLESSIEEMKTDTGVWHRVYIGPFSSRSEMAKARGLTAQSDIDTLLLKRSQ